MRRFWLAAVYYLGFTPVGLVARLVHDPLRRRVRRRAATYWTAPR